jgi:hypothetical protein
MGKGKDGTCLVGLPARHVSGPRGPLGLTKPAGILRRSTPCEIFQSLPCLFSQSCPLYDVQAPVLFVFTVLPSV